MYAIVALCSLLIVSFLGNMLFNNLCFNKCTFTKVEVSSYKSIQAKAKIRKLAKTAKK